MTAIDNKKDEKRDDALNPNQEPSQTTSPIGSEDVGLRAPADHSVRNREDYDRKLDLIEQKITLLTDSVQTRVLVKDDPVMIVESLKKHLEKIRNSELEKVREIERLNSQESVCNSLMIFLQEIGQQLEQFSDNFKSMPDTNAFREMMDQTVESLLKKSVASDEKAIQTSSIVPEIGSTVLEKLNDIQFQFEHVIARNNQSSAPDTSIKDEMIQLMDLKMDRIIQHLDFLQQDFQELRFNQTKMMNGSTDQETPSKLDVAVQSIGELKGEFQNKIKIDQQKDKLIDNLHKELQDYKGDLQKKFLLSIIMDIIQIIDNIRRLTSHYSKEPGSTDPEKLFKLLESIPTDLEDLFYMQGITPYTCDSDTFDPVRQRVLKKLDTTDINKNKKIAERIRPGYIWEEKIIRPEMVAAYIYKETSEGTIDEAIA